MSDDKLEKEFRNKIDGHISEIDSDALWANLQEKRGVNKPSGKNKVIWVLLGLVLIGGIYCTISNLDNNSTYNTNSTSKVPSILDPNVGSSSSNSVKDSKTLNSNSSELQNSISIENKKTDLGQSNNKTEVADQNSISTSVTTIQTENFYKGETFNINNIDRRHHPQHSVTSNKIQKESSKQEVNKFKINTSNPSLDKSKLKASEEKINFIKESEQNNSRTDSTLIIADNASWLTDKILSLDPNMLEYNIDQPYLKKIPTVTNKKRSKFELGASFNYEYAFRNLNSTADELSIVGPAYAELRNESEKFIESYRASLFLRHNFKHNFRASVGVEYAQLTERFDSSIFIGSEFRVDSTTNAAAIKIDSFRIQKIHNRYSSINIPVQIGKSFGKRRLSYFIDIGALINISFEKSGQIFSSAQINPDFLDISTPVEELQEDLFKISYMAHTGLSYQLDNKTKIELGPQFHSSFTPEFRISSIETSRSYLGLRFNLIRSL